MKKFYFGLVSAVLFALAACTQDPADGPLNPGVEDDGNSVFFDVAMTLPSATGTRSQTDNDEEHEYDDDDMGGGKTPSDGDGENTGDDYEYGHDYENTVRTLLLVIADAQDNYIMHSYVNTLPTTAPGTNGTYDVVATAKFSRATIEKEYEAGGMLAGSTKVHLYAFCNPTSGLASLFPTGTNKNTEMVDNVKSGAYQSTAINTSWLNTSAILNEESRKVQVNSIWEKSSFMMTNAVIVTAELPSKEGWNSYTSESNPFHLSGENGNDPDNSKAAPESNEYRGAIKVERSAARFDFRDGAIYGDKASGTARTYKITGKQNVWDSTYQPEGQETAGGIKSDNINLYNVVLTKMSLVNMHKNFFFLRRVSDDGSDSEGTVTKETTKGWRIGAYETTKNYVVDVDRAAKDEGVSVTTEHTMFNYPLFSTETVADRSGSYTNSDTPTSVYKYNTANWFTDNIEDVLKGTNDTWAQSNSQYHIWRYLTENTFPREKEGGNLNQKVAYTTGIVFKAKIEKGQDYQAEYAEPTGQDGVKKKYFISKDLQDLLDGTTTIDANSPALYLYSGLLYAGFKDFAQTAFEEGEGSPVYITANEILKHWVLTNNNFAYKAEPADTDTSLTVEILWALNWAKDEQDNSDFNEIEGDPLNKSGKLYEYFTNKAQYTFDGQNTFFGQPTEGQTENFVPEASTNFKNLAVAKNITMYQAEKDGETWGYYCYYFYWNRHNNNDNNAKMGPMEFATVRNNVYKLSVSAINKLGHPTIPENDPDPIEPDDPDEEESVYMDVQIEVLPWVVRVNEIEF